MTQEQKATELIEKFMKPIDGLHKYPMCFDTAKQCALICVDEILQLRKGYFDCKNIMQDESFWQSVKQAIINTK